MFNQIDNYELEEIMERVMSRYDNFSYQRRPYLLRSKCPVCGGSRTNKLDDRFNAYYYNGDLMVNCYNCGYSSGSVHYIRTYHPSEYSILLENARNKRLSVLRTEEKREIDSEYKRVTSKTEKTLEEYLAEITTERPKVEEEKPSIFPRELPLCYSLNDISEEHPIVKYVTSRKIPRDKWNRLFFTTEFRKLSNLVVPNTYKIESPEPRLVLPIYNKDGYIESFQGRALREGNNSVRYITIKYSDTATKLYGLDTIDHNKTIYLMEGQIDSLFIENGMAITGGNVSTEELDEYLPKNRAFIMDHEDRHPDTIQRIRKLLNSGERIVLFDRVNWKGKDINQFVLNGVSIEEINEYIRNNTLSGLEANMRFSSWFKVDTNQVKIERRERFVHDSRKNGMEALFASIKKGT